MSFFFFFFSSRRRHTRYIGDWSSDVCSSDLPTMETFRQLLDWLSSRKELCTVGRKVDPKHELTAVMRRMQKGPNKALLFRNVSGSAIPVVTNVFGFRRTVAAALGVEEPNLLRSLVAKETRG